MSTSSKRKQNFCLLIFFRIFILFMNQFDTMNYVHEGVVSFKTICVQKTISFKSICNSSFIQTQIERFYHRIFKRRGKKRVFPPRRSSLIKRRDIYTLFHGISKMTDFLFEIYCNIEQECENVFTSFEDWNATDIFHKRLIKLVKWNLMNDLSEPAMVTLWMHSPLGHGFIQFVSWLRHSMCGTQMMQSPRNHQEYALYGGSIIHIFDFFYCCNQKIVYINK